MPRNRSSRRGLAPLELVLWLPILMFVMALMVIIGNAVVWKVRTATVSRHAVWRARLPRTGQVDPPPATWPQQRTSMAVEDDADLAPLAAAQPVDRVAHGPLDNFGVQPVLDMGRGKQAGDAELARAYPMLARMGEYRFDVEHPMLTDQFRYWEMSIPRNRYRRIPFIYELPKAPAGLSQAFSNAVRAVTTAPFRNDLDPLDRDQEIFNFYGYYVDFHPQIQPFSSIDEEEVYRERVEPLIDRIQGRPSTPTEPGVPSVAEQMTQFFINMYQQIMNQMQQ